MRKYVYLAFDLLCVCIALVAALYLRHGIPLIVEGKPEDIYLPLMVTLVSALVVFPLMRLHVTMWRHTSTSELADIIIAVGLVVLITNSSLFLISRLHMMPRSVPPMHWALAVGMMGGARVLVRKLLKSARDGINDTATAKQHVIVVGVCQTAELYLQFIKRIARDSIVVEGFVDSDVNLAGRMFQRHKVLGTPGQLPELLEQLRVHGVHIRQIVLARLIDDLPKEDKKILQAMKREGLIDLVHFAKHMGPQIQPAPKTDTDDFYQHMEAVEENAYVAPSGYYPYVKRAFDVTIGVALTLLLFPLIVLVCMIVALDVGFPLIFWQQRPGRHGKPFRLYKFRTMRHAGRRRDEDRLIHKSGDEMRTSITGKLLRRLRLDELPQLCHIITGTMSFVGPRPLLPEDQPIGGEIRLSIRPGVTGWAQIHGGDALSPEEKLVLDVWYIRHMSLLLDLRILLRSVIVVFKKDAPTYHVIAQMKKSFTAVSS